MIKLILNLELNALMNQNLTFKKTLWVVMRKKRQFYLFFSKGNVIYRLLKDIELSYD